MIIRNIQKFAFMSKALENKCYTMDRKKFRIYLADQLFCPRTTVYVDDRLQLSVQLQMQQGVINNTKVTFLTVLHLSKVHQNQKQVKRKYSNPLKQCSSYRLINWQFKLIEKGFCKFVFMLYLVIPLMQLKYNVF